jgi:hypothetical protein
MNALKRVAVSIATLAALFAGIFFGSQVNWDHDGAATAATVARGIAHYVGWHPAPRHHETSKP